MFGRTEKTVESKTNKNKNGYQIIIRDLDNGEEIVNSTTRAVIGAYEDGQRGGVISVEGIVVTSCNTPTLIGTIEVAEKAVAQTKKTIIDNLPPEVLLAALLGGKRE